MAENESAVRLSALSETGAKERGHIPLGAAFPLLCCDPFSTAFSVCRGDKRVTHSLPVCAAWAVTARLAVDPGTPAGTAKQEANSRLEIHTSCHLPRFVNASNPTQPSSISVSAPPPPRNSLADRQPSAKTSRGHGSHTAHELKILSQDSMLPLCRRCCQHAPLYVWVAQTVGH